MNRMWSRIGLAALLTLCAVQAQAQAPGAGQDQVRRVRQSWTADRRAFTVGDVITVLVDEYTLATANKGTFASDRRFRDMGAGASQNIVTLPGGRNSGQVGVSSTNEAESRQRGEATRQNRFRGEMTVRVTEVEEGGLLRIEGRKLISVDKHKEELTLTGYVRPQDVSAQNMVDSWRVGDAELVYTSSGGLDNPRGGLITRLLSKLWP